MDYAIVFAFGLIFGSFANVCIWRLPRNESIVFPASRCPKCGARISPLDNIPLLSYLMLRGRCRSCANPISWRYPAVEAAMGLIAAGAYRRFGPTLAAGETFLLGFVFLVLLVSDLETRILPDTFSLGGMAIPLAFSILAGVEPQPLDRLLGGALASALVLFVLLAHFHLRGYYGMGYGDVKLMALAGMCFGFPGFFKPLIGSCLLALAVSVPFILLGRKGWKYPVPFGAFLGAGCLAGLFWR